MRATKAQADMQPKLAELKKKHAKDAQMLAQEQMKLYRESGISPAGCLLPMLLQMPIWIALYQAIIRVMATNPESFVNLSGYLYSWPVVYSALPLNNNFLWLNLALPDVFLAIVVGASMWVQQKMTAPATTDPQQRAQTQTMQVMMPFMFTLLSLSFPSGLALYWVVSNIISIVMQYFFSGWGGLSEWIDRLPFRGWLNRLSSRTGKPPSGMVKISKAPTSPVTGAEIGGASAGRLEENRDEGNRDKRPDSGGGQLTRPPEARRQARPGRNRRSKRR
jgi:YidC/Oxa1 family membrane protein insertase